MKEGWKYVKLGDIATFTRGLTYSKNDEVGISSKIVLRSNNVNLSDGQLNFDDLKYLSESFVIPLDKKVKKGSLLMCMSNGSKAHLGKVALIEEDLDYAFGGFMGLVSHSDLVEDNFFWYSLITPAYKDFIRSLSAGANINNLKIKDLETFTIPLPPLSEQQSIVAHLDASFAEIDALKAKAAEEVANAKAMFDAALKEEMTPKEGWEENTIGRICQLKSGNSSANNSKVGELPFVKVGDLNLDENKEGIVTSSRLVCKEENIKGIFPIGTTIFPKRGGAILTNKKRITKVEICCDLNIMGVIPRIELDPVFLFYYFINTDLRNLYDGASIPQINNCNIAPLLISFPDRIIQQRIVAKLDTLRSHLTELEQKYNLIASNCDALKQAILKQVFE